MVTSWSMLRSLACPILPVKVTTLLLDVDIVLSLVDESILGKVGTVVVNNPGNTSSVVATKSKYGYQYYT